MIVTIVGDLYEQRHLLERRAVGADGSLKANGNEKKAMD